MASVDLGKCLSSAVEDFKKDPVTHVVAHLLFLVVNAFSFSLLAGPMAVGYVRMLDKSRRGEAIGPGDLFAAFDQFVPALVAVLLGGVAVAVGSMLCIVPGLLVAPVVPVAVFLVARGEGDGVNALKRAWEMVKGNLVMAAVTLFVLQLVGSLGLILCFVGVLVTAPIALIGAYHLSVQLAE